MCKPFYVGSGEDRCISCLDFCHGNSETCVNAKSMSNKNQSLDIGMTNITMVSRFLYFSYDQLHCVVMINRVMVFNLMNPFAFNVKTTLLEGFAMNVFQDIFIKKLQNHFNAAGKFQYSIV